MEKKLIRMDNTEEGDINYVYEEMLPTETIIEVTVDQHKQNVEEAQEKLEMIMKDKEELEMRLIELNEKALKVNDYLDKLPIIESVEQEQEQEQ